MNTYFYKPFNPLFSAFDDSTHYSDKTVDSFRVDIEENDSEYRIHADLPGIKKEDVNINVKDNLLTVDAKFSRSVSDGVKSLRSERFDGSRSRHFRLSNNVDASAVSASMQDGLLTLSLPKAINDNERRIDIK